MHGPHAICHADCRIGNKIPILVAPDPAIADILFEILYKVGAGKSYRPIFIAFALLVLVLALYNDPMLNDAGGSHELKTVWPVIDEIIKNGVGQMPAQTQLSDAERETLSAWLAEQK